MQLVYKEMTEVGKMAFIQNLTALHLNCLIFQPIEGVFLWKRFLLIKNHMFSLINYKNEAVKIRRNWIEEFSI
ncbi:hypothetical protein ABE28_009545 [Peribacillus muralis]|uniref:Uncharacterized protein n=1 Tax=Peribacillus muralis TaxID=264697 RepID=A0A1B3XMZ8_9BACI|nr:hypothetical protein ABE28_009545 [Peribacillus muralis]